MDFDERIARCREHEAALREKAAWFRTSGLYTKNLNTGVELKPEDHAAEIESHADEYAKIADWLESRRS